jgi:predicted DNA-binding transcriptional regulator YafY
MLETSARLLRLLTLMQTRPTWVGSDLARRLEVTDRTLRRDVERLRRLGYPVQATVGTGGGYRLGPGTSLPPLMLDNDEAVAVVLGLRTAVRGSVSNLEEASTRALTKLEQLLPRRLRRRVAALGTSIVSVTREAPAVSSRTLTALAAACHDCERVAFDYRGHGGEQSRRSVEPHRLVHTGRRFYLVAWDVQRRDWRTFRVDRVAEVSETAVRFIPRPPPDEDLGRYVSQGVSLAAYPFRGRVLLHAPIEQAARAVTPDIGHLESVDAQRCVLTLGSQSSAEMANWLGVFGFDFDVLDPAELATAVARVATRLSRAARAFRGSAHYR